MFKKILIAFAAVAGVALSQTEIPQPAYLLPKADHSAPGTFCFYDLIQTNCLTVSYNTIVVPTLSTGLIVKEQSGTTTSHTLSLQTNGGTEYFYVIGGTDAAAPGRVVVNSAGLEVTPTVATFPGVTVAQSLNQYGLEVDQTSGAVGLGAALFTANSSGPALTATSTWATTGIAASFTGPFAIRVNGEIEPGAAGTYDVGDSTNYFRNGVFGTLDGPSHSTNIHTMVPAITDTYDVGSVASEVNNLYVKNLHCTGTGCASTNFWSQTGTTLSPTGSWNVVANTSGNALGLQNTPWGNIYTEGIMTYENSPGSIAWQETSSGSANVLSWKDSSSNTRMQLQAIGSACNGGSGVCLAAPSTNMIPTATNSATLVLNAVSSQTANILEVNNSTPAMELKIDASGTLFVGSGLPLFIGLSALGGPSKEFLAIYSDNYVVGPTDVPGVSCTGAPTGAFQSINGIVVHC